MNNIAEIISVIVVGLIGGIAVGLQVPMSGVMSQKLGVILLVAGAWLVTQ